MTHIKSLHVTHETDTGIHIHLSLNTKCPLQRKPSQRKDFTKVKNKQKWTEAPGMANLESLCLSQGQGTPVGLSLVDKSSNHIDVIIRNLVNIN